MPFKSEKQRKWMHANKPKMAKKWEKEESVDEFKIPAGEQKLVYQFKGFTASQMDELHAMLHRAGIVTTPDFNKRTITTHANRDAMKIKKNKTIQKFIKSKGGKQIKESVNEAMSESQRFKVYNSLKKGDVVSIKYDSSIQKGTKYIPYVVSKGKTKLMKGKIERIILKSPKNPRFKAYLYNRNGDVSLALGDMAASIVDMKKGKVKESVVDERLKKGQKIIALNPKDKTLKGKVGVIYSVGIGNSTSYVVQVGKGKKTRFAIMTDKEIKLKESVKEERDYKDEYKKFQSSTKAKKYRAELNKYNRKKGTYGNGDGKDASHKGGKIVGFEAESKNRGRAEKSRLKKEGVLTENPAAIAAGVRAAMARAKEKELSAGGGKKVKVSTALANKSHPKHKQAKGIIQRIKDRAKSMLSKSKKKKTEPKKQSKSDANFYARQFGATSESVNEQEKRKLTDPYNDFERLVGNFGKEVIRITKDIDKLKGDKTDGNIIKKQAAKSMNPFIALVRSWYKTVQKNPHIDEKKGDFLNSLFPKAKVDKAIKIAKSMGGDMSGAVKKIEKFFPGMTKHTKVQDALRHANEGFGGQLKGADKKKFEKARTKNGEQLGYTLTGTSDVKVVSEKFKK